MDHNDTKIIKNSMWLYLRMFIVTLITLYTSRIVLQILGFEDYGIYNLTGGIVAFMSVLKSAMTNGTQRFLNKEKAVGSLESLSRMMQISIKLHQILAFCIIVLCETLGLYLVAFVLNIPEGRYWAAIIVYQTSVFVLVLSILQIPYNSLIITEEKFSFIAATGLVDVFLKLTLVFCLIYIPFDKLVFYGVAVTIASIIQFIWFKYCCRDYFVKMSVCYDEVYKSQQGREILSFSSWNLLGVTGNMLATQGVGIVFNQFYPLAINAALGITNQVTDTIASFVNNVQMAFRPQLLQAYSKKEYSRFLTLVCNCSKYSLFLILFLAVPFICNMSWILHIWLGNVPDYAVEFIDILILYLIIDSLGNPVYYGIEAQGNIRNYQILLFVLLFFNVVCAWICCALGFTPVAAILTKLVTNIFVFLLRVFYLQIYCNMSLVSQYVRKTILPSLVPLSISGLFMVVFKGPTSLFQLFFTTIVYWCILTIIILYSGFTKSERKSLIDIFYLKVKKR